MPLPHFIKSELFEYLGPKQQLELRLANRDFNALLAEIVFKTVDFRLYVAHKGKPATFENYGKHVRHLIIDDSLPEAVALLGSFQEVRRLTLSDVKDTQIENVIFLIQAFRYLKQLELSCFPALHLPRLAEVNPSVKIHYHMSHYDNGHFNSVRDHVLGINITKLTLLLSERIESPVLQKMVEIPALEVLSVSLKNYQGHCTEFIYDVKQTKFLELKFRQKDEPTYFYLYLDHTAYKTTPLLYSHPGKVAHTDQFKMLQELIPSGDGFPDLLLKVNSVDAFRCDMFKGTMAKLNQVLGPMTQASVLFLNFFYDKMEYTLPAGPFKAKLVNLHMLPRTPVECYSWLANPACFPNLEEIFIDKRCPFVAADLTPGIAFKHLRVVNSEHDHDAPFWRQLIAMSPQLQKILLPATSVVRGPLSQEFPYLFFGYTQPAPKGMYP